MKVEEPSCEFLLCTSRDKKVRGAKDHCKKFRSKLAASFSGIVSVLLNCLSQSRIDVYTSHRLLVALTTHES